MDKETDHVLEHKTNGKWYSGRHLGSDPRDARDELTRARALAAASDTNVTHRIVRHTREILGW